MGNIGKPALETFAKGNSEDTVYVYELSSHQLYDLDRSPDISVVLNIGTDHLDWHGTQDEYLKAKKNIVFHQKKGDLTVLNFDDLVVRNFGENTKAKTVFFGKKNQENDAYLEGDSLYVNGKVVLDKKKVKLKGDHNLSNIMALVLVVTDLGVGKDAIQEIVYAFTGLEHRLEEVGEHKDVLFVNDSMSTNSVSMEAALSSFSDRPITLILGGHDRGIEQKNIALLVAGTENIKNVVLIGETAEMLEREIVGLGFGGKLLNLGKKDMNTIVDKAFNLTPKGGVVLLSPAAASFDMFENYKDRGNQFKKAARSLR